jgi:hypothetical protein
MDKPNQPLGVIEHEHFFEDIDTETGRIDACALRDGTFVVWDVDNDVIVTRPSGFRSFVEACEFAHRMTVMRGYGRHE